jgi:hypothetical protein
MENEFSNLVKKLVEIEEGLCAIKFNTLDTQKNLDQIFDILVQKKIIEDPQLDNRIIK